jgi:hypothetical protein
MSMNKSEDFKLGKEDAAIVIGKDLAAQIYLPTFEDDVELKFEEHKNIYITMAIMMAFNDPEFQTVINKKLDVIFSSAEMMDGCDPKGCPGCGGGGCDV